MGQSLPLGLLLGVGLVLLCSCCQLTAWLCPGAKDTMTVGYRIGRCQISSSSSTEQRPSAAGGSDHSNIRFSLWSPVAPAPRRHLHFSYLRKQGAAWALIALLWPPIFRSRAVREVRADEERGRRKARGLVIFAAGFQAFPWVASELCERPRGRAMQRTLGHVGALAHLPVAVGVAVGDGQMQEHTMRLHPVHPDLEVHRLESHAPAEVLDAHPA